MTEQLPNGWDHAEANKRIDPRVKPGINVPGVTPAATAPVSQSASAAPSAVSASATSVVPQATAPAATAPVAPVPAPKLSLSEKIKAALAKDGATLEHDLEDIIGGK